jgi:DNA-binding PadR family transcriptional regulator
VSRLFRRGELTAAVLEIVGRDEPVHGYGVLAALTDTLGRWWRPSPGAVYPALVALEDAGLIEGRAGGSEGDTRTYRLTPAGRDALGTGRGVLDRVQTRAAGHPPAPTLAHLVDRFAADLPGRATRLDDVAVVAVEQILERTHHQLTSVVSDTVAAGSSTGRSTGDP